MGTIAEEIQQARGEARAKDQEAERLAKLAELYPDLRKHVGRWNKVAYCSASVNSQVTKFDMRHNCGCCNDSPLEIWPYVETPHGKIHSDPPMFFVGERKWGGGDRPYADWDGKLRAAGIPEEVIHRVGLHLSDDEDEEGTDDEDG